MGRGSFVREVMKANERRNVRFRRARALLAKYQGWGYETALTKDGRAFYLSKDGNSIFEYDFSEGKWRESNGL